MSNTLKTAAVFGATGLVGNELVKLLLNDKRYDKVKIFTRRSLNLNHPKIEEHIIDFNRLGDYNIEIKSDHVFCCLGTTAKKTPDKNEYEQIDLQWPIQIAQICRQNKSESYAVISSIGASEKSSTFYLKTKGRMEKGVLLSAAEKTTIVRPSFLMGERKEKRFGENIGIVFMKIASFFLVGGLKKYKPIKASKVASALILLSNSKTEKSIFENNELF